MLSEMMYLFSVKVSNSSTCMHSSVCIKEVKERISSTCFLQYVQIYIYIFLVNNAVDAVAERIKMLNAEFSAVSS